MRQKVKMGQVIDMMILDKESQGLSPRTLENYRHVLQRFHRQVGDIYPGSLEPHHYAAYFAARPKGAGLRVDHSVLKQWTVWCIANGHMGRHQDHMAGRRVPRTMPRQRRRLEATAFPELLDAAGRTSPRDRITVALGLYLFLRAGEMRDLRIKDLDLQDGYMRVRITKTRQVDEMPICLELDRELRAWLSYYSVCCGPLHDDNYLVPRFDLRWGRGEMGRSREHALRAKEPTSRTRLARAVGQALQGIGWDVTPDDREGVHTLRRSGARALFDSLVDRSYDRALERVQSMLHHSNTTMTEHYLGIEASRHKRNVTIKGVAMFPVPDQGVTRLRASG